VWLPRRRGVSSPASLARTRRKKIGAAPKSRSVAVPEEAYVDAPSATRQEHLSRRLHRLP
jgi:hypothetical protein